MSLSLIDHNGLKLFRFSVVAEALFIINLLAITYHTKRLCRNPGRHRLRLTCQHHFFCVLPLPFFFNFQGHSGLSLASLVLQTLCQVPYCVERQWDLLFVPGLSSHTGHSHFTDLLHLPGNASHGFMTFRRQKQGLLLLIGGLQVVCSFPSDRLLEFIFVLNRDWLRTFLTIVGRLIRVYRVRCYHDVRL